MSVAIEIHRACRAEIEARGGGRLQAVRIVVGELAGIEVDSLRFAWEAVTRDIDAGSRLEIDWRPVRQICDTCGVVAARTEGTWLHRCPTCGGPLRLEAGRELSIHSIAFDETKEVAPL